MGLRAYLFGKSSEDLACEFLLKNGCEILARNFSSKFGEIDVIAKKDGILRFVEIKATQGDYEAEYRLTPAKFNKILKTIDFYLLQKPKDESPYATLFFTTHTSVEKDVRRTMEILQEQDFVKEKPFMMRIEE